MQANIDFLPAPDIVMSWDENKHLETTSEKIKLLPVLKTEYMKNLEFLNHMDTGEAGGLHLHKLWMKLMNNRSGNHL
ncbi:hypothetical protein AV530_012570 [Patagioenas fasciata monilis]|uniref:Uncharacterized protein n=1 Tax=Patagioenas fasciata monilis TaxID=372326 RepID=A0A1V4JBS2_PATFA|nr:hypothetical protein AV530_012570 [Patagioenas fasciata monilis]